MIQINLQKEIIQAKQQHPKMGKEALINCIATKLKKQFFLTIAEMDAVIDELYERLS